ncbi:MAG: methyltransferase domain-containing protein [Pseudonocardiales bacterium]
MRIDLDRAVADTVHLESLPGAVELLLQQCHDIGAPVMTAIRRAGDSVVLDHHGPLRELAGLRMFSALSLVLGEDPITALRQSRAVGVLGALGTTDIGFRVDPLPDRWDLRDRISAALGWRNDPRDWQVNVTRSGDLLLGQVGPLHRSSRFPAMSRLPASTNPVVAAMMVELLKVSPGDVVYDPFCGSGTLLVETLANDCTDVLLGSDISPVALAAAAANRRLFATAPVLRADAARLPVVTNSVDRVIANLPFGKRVGSHADNTVLYPAFLAELNRVLRADGRAVLLTEDKTLFRRSVAAAAGLRVLREVQLASGGLHPSAFVIERTRTARGRATPANRRPPRRPARPSGS